MKKLQDKIVIAGPCSVESEAQLNQVLEELSGKVKLYAFRGGIWKPRTRPNSFEGKGAEALTWMKRVGEEHNLSPITEVANAEHVKAVLNEGFTKLWIGARTTANPFAVQEIADALSGVENIEVFIKNPINPDLNLWVGAVERIQNVGVKKIGLIHRGFSVIGDHPYRNVPMWQIPLEMMTIFPDYPMLCDPSHIAGNRALIESVVQKSMDLAYQGIIIETHPDPDNALSDPEQQVTPEQLLTILDSIIVRSVDTAGIEESLEELRARIDILDEELLNAIRSRMDIAQKIGQYKKAHGITIYQKKRWEQILTSRKKIAQQLQLSEIFTEQYLDAIHLESIRQQTNVMNPKATKNDQKDKS